MKKIFVLLITSVILLSACWKTEQNLTGSWNKITPTHEKNLIPTHLKSLEWVGTEPFWAFRYSWDKLIWQVPGSGEDPSPVSTTYTVEAKRNTKANTVLLSGTGITVELTNTECRDGMSENIYAFTAEVKLGETKFSWCARQFIAK